jgi:hypothetical protein
LLGEYLFDVKPPVQDAEPKPPVADTKVVAGNDVVVALQTLLAEAQKQSARRQCRDSPSR